MSPPIMHILKYFVCDHLPPHLQVIARPFAELAAKIANGADNPETTVALRKLLEAKDAAVRAALPLESKNDSSERQLKEVSEAARKGFNS